MLQKPISLCYSYLWQAVPSPKNRKRLSAQWKQVYNDSLFIKAR